MEYNESLEKIGKSIADIKRIQDDEKDSANSSGVFLFFSFDLSDSTEFKTEHPSLWANVFTEFYEEVLSYLGVENYKSQVDENSESQCIRKLWKLIGDEVLIYVEIYEAKQLYRQIVDVYQAMKEMMSRIAEHVAKKCEDEKCLLKHCQDIEKIIKHTLGIKVTAWIAECSEKNMMSPNIIYRPITSTPSWGRVDFLGRDIDEGFRIAKYAVRNKIILSPLLAWLIGKAAERDDDQKKLVESNLKIVSYVKLKGVWRNRKVPIVMFHQNFKEFEKILEYDEIDIETFSNVKEYGVGGFLNEEQFNIYRIDSILKNIYRDEEAITIFEKLNKPCDYEQSFTIRNKYQEFHIACVIFDQDNNIMIHENNNCKWECGYIVHSLNAKVDSWKTLCEKGYEDKYGIKIEVEELPVPVAVYSHESEDFHQIFGLIVIAKYIESEETITNWKSYPLDEILNLEEQPEVENFKQNLKKAYSIWEKNKDGNTKYR